ncbi:glutamate-gated chloride channel-like, partial [Mercenaria mercenaria]|uniref:glutamate-gated chloride channel-like n=1 Tax=Mercenaria mercenaria TaxID=6596 RepID=UPI00234FA333
SSHASSHILDSGSLVMEALCTMQYKENYIHVSTFAVIDRDIHRSLWIINENSVDSLLSNNNLTFTKFIQVGPLKATTLPNWNSVLKEMYFRITLNIANIWAFVFEYECTLYIRLNWRDERLDYSHLATYDHLTLTGEDIRKYWIPDLYFHHAKEARYHQVFRTNELVYIGQNGSVTYSARLTILSHCQLVLYYYPFDKQNCDITIQSYASEADDLILEWAKKYPFKVQGTEYISIIDDSTTSTFTSPYLDPLGNYSTLHANLRFKRAHKKFDVMYIAPPVIFFLVAFFSFLLLEFDDLKAQIHSRLQVCTGMLVSTIMLWGGIYAKLPPVAVLAKLDLWMLAHVILIAIIIVFHLVLFLLECFVSDYRKRIQCFAIGMCVIMLLGYIFVAVFYTLDWKEG